MSKIEDYEFSNLPSDVGLFKDDVRDLVNNGKFQFQVGTSTPTFKGNRGEMYLLLNGTQSALYVNMGNNSVWSVAAIFTASS